MRLVNIYRRLRRELFDSYRPELHYMRGPGPRWREKHAPIIIPVLSISRQRQIGWSRLPTLRATA
jgi:hypothetical protein